jgi:hydrogenase nickel incorporation protein HypA/HybF
MHELGIAQAIVEQSVEAARSAGSTRVTAVRVRIGELSGVAEEALRFCWDIATAGTILDAARLDCEQVAGQELRIEWLECPG